MSNIIQFQAKQHRAIEQGSAADEYAAFSALVKAAALRANAKDTLYLLADQLESAMQHARAIEPHMRDARVRQDFADRIEVVQRLLDVARVKILQL